MNEKTARNWIAKAESDLKIGKDEFTTENPATDAICFHMQQCVEKYLKAFLIVSGRRIRRTHDIVELIEGCAQVDPTFVELSKINADRLTEYAVELRYPEEFYFPSLEETKRALEIAEKAKNFVSEKLKSRGLDL